MLTKYLYILGGVAGIALATFVFTFIYRSGINSCEVKHEQELKKVIEQEQAKQAKLAAELETERGKIRIEYRTRIRTVKEAADPTGCADTRMPDPFLDSLQYTSGGSVKTFFRLDTAYGEAGLGVPYLSLRGGGSG